MGGIASGRPGAASTPWVPAREAWDRARSAYRDARWSGTLETIAANETQSARAESLYLGALESWALAPNTQFLTPRPGTQDQTRLREGALDLAEDGRSAAALRLLSGPLRDDPMMLPLRARLTGSVSTPDSGLAVIDWPPDRRADEGERPIAWDFLGRAPGDEIDAARVAAAALADSAREPRAARAALWTLLGNPRPAVRSYARIRLARSLISAGEPLLAGEMLASSYGMSDDERLLLANLRADQAAALRDTLEGVRLLIQGATDAQITTATRYALAMRAAKWLRGARVDSLEEAAWVDLVRTLGTIGEGETALSLFRARRTRATSTNQAVANAELEASLLARVKRNTEAVTAYRKLLARTDQSRDARARYALGLARALRGLGEFQKMDDAFVLAASLDPTGGTGAQAAWERGREWESQKTPAQTAAIYSWSRAYIHDANLLRGVMGHSVIAWLRAGQPDSAKTSVIDSFEDERGYWWGKIDLARGDTAAAIVDYQSVPLVDPWSYEGVRAKEELTRWGAPLNRAPKYGPAPPPAKVLERSAKAGEVVEASAPPSVSPEPMVARLYGAIGATELEMDALRDCAQSTDDVRARTCTDELEEKGIFRVGRSNLLPWDRLEYPPAYPAEVLHAAERESVSAAFLWAIMRQESAYQRAARSKAGALGLLQLMTPTASRLNGSPVTEASLTDADLNVRLGARYVRKLFDEFRDPRAVAAAYNAGEDVVRRWMRDRPVVDDFWVELIPYRETRDYVKQVYTIWRRYEALYGDAAPRDTMRGPRG
jgi:soluble lytic murein transglycosylase-like protein